MKRSAIPFTVGLVLLVFVLIVSQLTDQLPELPTLTLPRFVAALLVLGGALGWFLPSGGLALSAAIGVVVCGAIVATGGLYLLVLPELVPVIGGFFIAFFIGRAAVIACRLDHRKVNDQVGLTLLLLMLASPGAWMLWDGRHSILFDGFGVEAEPEVSDERWLMPRQKWALPVGMRHEGAPVAVAGRVFLTAGGVLYAVNSDGQGAWMVPNATTPPILDDGKLYVGLESALARIDPGTGRIIWTVDVSGLERMGDFEHRRRLSVGPSGRIYVNPEHGTIYAIDPQGSPAWTLNEYLRGAPVEGPSGSVYAASGDWSRARLSAIDAKGKLIWRRTLPAKNAGSVAVGADESIYVPTEQRLFAFTRDGRERWRRRFRSGLDDAVVDPGGNVVVSSGNRWYVLDDTGHARHMLPTPGRRPVFAGGEALLLGDDALKAYDGEGHALYVLRPAGSPSVFDGSDNELVLGPDGMLYVQTRDELIGFLRPAPPYRVATQ